MMSFNHTGKNKSYILNSALHTGAILDHLIETVFIVDSMKNMVDLIRMVLFFDKFVFSRTKMAKYMDKEQSEDDGSIETVLIADSLSFHKAEIQV